MLFKDRISSDAWDSVPELVALAQNSRPTERLANTSAGIQRGRSMAEHVRIRSVRHTAEEEAATTSGYLGEQLQLVFDDHPDNRRGSGEVVVDTLYGKL